MLRLWRTCENELQVKATSLRLGPFVIGMHVSTKSLEHSSPLVPQPPARVSTPSPGPMWPRPIFTSRAIRARALSRPPCILRRHHLMTLAIETSCDDTSVAIVEKSTENGHAVARLHFHQKVTSNNAEYQGVHPLVSLQSHQENLAKLVSEAIEHLPPNEHTLGPQEPYENEPNNVAYIPTRRLPDFISVTRGPGMRSNLFTGLDTAKGLAVAWQVLNAHCFANTS
jgi:hypothetical protein